MYRLYKGKESLEQIHSCFPTRTKESVRQILVHARTKHKETYSAPWTIENLKKLEALREQGLPWARIQAEAFPNWTVGAIQSAYARAIRSQKLSPRRSWDWTEQDQGLLIKLTRAGKVLHELKKDAFPHIPRYVLRARLKEFRAQDSSNTSIISYWTLDEVERLKDLLKFYDVKQISDMMDRPVRSVISKAEKLGLKMIRPPKSVHAPWTTEELAVLEPTLSMFRAHLYQLKQSLPNRGLLEITKKRSKIRTA